MSRKSYPGIEKMRATITRIAADSDDPQIRNLINQINQMSHAKIFEWYVKLKKNDKSIKPKIQREKRKKKWGIFRK